MGLSVQDEEETGGEEVARHCEAEDVDQVGVDRAGDGLGALRGGGPV